ncbi:MAG: hypothetical protein J0L78_09435 [Planctomycetes bacterium]|nr:hypothetical protein [Planctomycetota bacterium]
MSNSFALRHLPLLAGAVFSFAALGALNNQARVSIQPDFFGGTGPVDNIVQQPGTVDASGSATGGGNSSGNGNAHTQYGYINLRSHAEVSLNATARGIIQDKLTFSAPGFPAGTSASVTYSFRVEGSLSAPAGVSGSSWDVTTDLGGGAFDLRKSGRLYSPLVIPSGYQGDPFGTYTATGTVSLGFAATLYLELTVNADASNHPNQTGLATVHYGRLYWNGITDVKINGVSVPGATATSESGTNWGVPITPCAGDLNGDNLVDDSDFVLFVSAYNILDCGDPAMPAGCPADLNNDGFVDDSDFVQFVGAYDQLVCP